MKNISKVAAALALGAMVSGQAEAQLSNTLYFHHYNYRTHFINPGTMPDYQSYFGFPLIGTLAVEMESAVLYMNAARAGKNALCICTVSNSLITGFETPAEERQNSFKEMMEVALGIAVSYEKDHH